LQSSGGCTPRDQKDREKDGDRRGVELKPDIQLALRVHDSCHRQKLQCWRRYFERKGTIDDNLDSTTAHRGESYG
jgi:hypothetical protein